MCRKTKQQINIVSLLFNMGKLTEKSWKTLNALIVKARRATWKKVENNDKKCFAVQEIFLSTLWKLKVRGILIKVKDKKPKGYQKLKTESINNNL